MDGYATPGTCCYTALSKLSLRLIVIQERRLGAAGEVAGRTQHPCVTLRRRKQEPEWESMRARRTLLPKSTDAVAGWHFNQCYLCDSDIRKKTSRVCLLSGCCHVCQLAFPLLHAQTHTQPLLFLYPLVHYICHITLFFCFFGYCTVLYRLYVGSDTFHASENSWTEYHFTIRQP